MKITAHITATVILNEQVEIIIYDEATKEEIEKALLEEAGFVFGEQIQLSNGLTPDLAIESYATDSRRNGPSVACQRCKGLSLTLKTMEGPPEIAEMTRRNWGQNVLGEKERSFDDNCLHYQVRCGRPIHPCALLRWRASTRNPSKRPACSRLGYS